jgi:tetratricopeptide (TPR) repeat protein
MKILSTILAVLVLNISGLAQISNKAKADSLQTAAWDASQKNYFKKCLRLIDSSLYYDSTNSWSYSIKAEAHWLIGQYGEAAKAHKKAMSLDKDSLLIGAFVLQGMLYDKANMHDKAKEEYLIASKLWEGGYVPYKQLAKHEQVDYVFAVGLYGDTSKWKKKLHELYKKYPDKNYIHLADKSGTEILDFYFNSEFAMPKGVTALED